MATPPSPKSPIVVYLTQDDQSVSKKSLILAKKSNHEIYYTDVFLFLMSIIELVHCPIGHDIFQDHMLSMNGKMYDGQIIEK